MEEKWLQMGHRLRILVSEEGRISSRERTENLFRKNTLMNLCVYESQISLVV